MLIQPQNKVLLKQFDFCINTKVSLLYKRLNQLSILFLNLSQSQYFKAFFCQGFFQKYFDRTKPKNIFMDFFLRYIFIFKNNFPNVELRITSIAELFLFL